MEPLVLGLQPLTPASASAFPASAVERELCGRFLDGYLADHLRGRGPPPERAAAQAGGGPFASGGEGPRVRLCLVE